MPDPRITILEIEENLLRKELTPAERDAQMIRWVALNKLNGGNPATPVTETAEAAENGKLIPILTPARRGRGNKGLAHKLARRSASASAR
jgi:hypothetical protein